MSGERDRGFVVDGGERAWRCAPWQTSGAAAAGVPEPFVSYPAADEAIVECERRIVRAATLPTPHLALIGESENGKQAILRWIARRHRPFRVPSASLPVVPLVVTELPLSPKGQSLQDTLMGALGMIEAPDGPAAAYRAAGVRLVVVRSAHDLVDFERREQDDTLSKLRNFASDAQVGLMFVGTPTIEEALQRHVEDREQIHRVRLPAWTSAPLATFLRALQQAWNHPAADWSQFAPALVEITGGRVGGSVRRLTRAMRQADPRDAAAIFERLWDVAAQEHGR